MGTEETTNDANICFEHRNIYVRIEIRLFKQNIDDASKFSEIAHHSQCIKRINQC